MDFITSLKKFDDAFRRLPEKNLSVKPSQITDFEEKKASFLINSYQTAMNALLSAPIEGDKSAIEKIDSLKKQLKSSQKEKTKEIIAELYALSAHLEESPSLSFRLPSIPSEIKTSMEADINELSRCFSNRCYRASIILCGRVLETALHRKYYESTGMDILEKNPGIGLGTLIAKMKEKNISLDPGLSQQIHLINQVRIFSVHTKQEEFNPSHDQTHAIILYTLDSVRKLFSK